MIELDIIVKKLIELDMVTKGFITVMIIYALIYVFKLNKNISYESYIPEAIAAIGILGTFAGITLGLLSFDEANLDKSITGLLGGMKTAFITSLVGLSISTTLKMWSQSKKRKFLGKEDGIEEKLGKLIEIMSASDNSTVATAINELKESSITTNKTMVESMGSMEKSIISLVSEDENSLISQMSALKNGMMKAQSEAQERLNTGLGNMEIKLGDLVTSNNSISKEIENGNRELIGHFKGFRDEMAKAFTEEFTNALTKSIEDLNTQLQEQLGENFKNAVNKLVDWQEHYIETIKNTTIVLDKTMEAIQSTDKSMENISKRSDSLIKVSEKLVPTIEELNTIQSDLTSGMSKMSQVSDEFKEKMPLLLKSTEDLSNLALNKINKTLGEFGTFGNEFENLTVNIAKNIDNSAENLHKNIEKSIQSTIDNSNMMLEISQEAIEKNLRTGEELSTKHEELLTGISITLDGNVECLVENINKVVNEFDIKLSTHTEQAISNMKNNTNLLTETAQAQVGNMEDVNQRIATSYEQIIAELSQRLKEVFEKSSGAMNDSIGKLEEGLENNLENSLNSLVGALSKVSEKFVDDYTPLTRKLKEVVEIARDI